MAGFETSRMGGGDAHQRFAGDADSSADKEQEKVNEWVRFGMRLAVSTAFHPLEYSKVLIQLGYEPIAPRPGKSIFGKPIMVLPNIFQYAGYIRRCDGWIGCYRGLSPKIVGSIVSLIFSEHVADRLGLSLDEALVNDAETDEELYAQFKVSLKRDIVLTATSIVSSHPFHVIAVRMMAQFVGREKIYNSIFGSIIEIYRHEGIKGFFSGLVPKLLCDLACVVLTTSTVYMVNKYIIKDKVGRQYNSGFVQFAFSSILYPLQVVSTCMCVTGSPLAAGQPPIMPEYLKWSDCWNDLQARGELKRGNSLFWRSTRLPKQRNYDGAPVPQLYPKIKQMNFF